MADCFVELVKMAKAISEIPPFPNGDFKRKCTAIFNKRWKEFNIDVYLLAFFLHPKYRGKNLILNYLYSNYININRNLKFLGSCFQRNVLKSKYISRIAVNIWKSQCGGGNESANLLLTQMDLYQNREDPFDEDHPYTEHVNTPMNWWSSLMLERGMDPIRRLALKLHAIMPHNADCERIFSILGWFLGKRRTK